MEKFSASILHYVHMLMLMNYKGGSVTVAWLVAEVLR